MNLKLNSLMHSKTLFKKLSAGLHINRHHEQELWMVLEQQSEDYYVLFENIGFELIIVQRGFAYFATEQSNNYNNKLTQQLALLLLLLFEQQADAGQTLYQFEQWYLDNDLITSLWHKHQALLVVEDITSPADINDIFNSASRVNFMLKEQNYYRLLPSVHRYLDLFTELAEHKKVSKT